MAKRVTSFPRQILICLTFSLMAILFSDNLSKAQCINIVSAGNYSLDGKRFYLAPIVSDSLGFELDNQQQLSLSNYVEEAMKTRGAVRVSDIVSADFILRVLVCISFSEESKEFTDKGVLSNSFRAFRFNGRNDFTTYTSDRYDSAVGKSSYSNPNLPYYASALGDNKRKNRVLVTSNYRRFKKELFLDAFVVEENQETPIWNALLTTQNVISRKYLCPFSGMLYVSIGVIGKDTPPKRLSLNINEDVYYSRFSAFSLHNNSDLSLFPAENANVKGMNVVVIERLEGKTIIVFEDRNFLNLDFRKSREIILKVGEQTFVASSVKYNSPPDRGIGRFLEVSFPVKTKSDQASKIIVFKNKKHNKVICEIDI